MDDIDPQPLPYFERIAQVFSEQLKSRMKNLISVVLYGSTARGKIDRGSDIDILIIAKDMPSEYHKRVDFIYPIIENIYQSEDFEMLRGMNYFPRIEYLILDAKEAEETSNLDFDLLTDARILFDDGFFSKKMSLLKEKMKKIGSKKVMINDRSWYWDLKPDLKIGEVIEI